MGAQSPQPPTSSFVDLSQQVKNGETAYVIPMTPNRCDRVERSNQLLDRRGYDAG